MIKEVNKFLKDLKTLSTKVKIYCQDLSIPLEDRWAVFEKVGMFFAKEDCYVVHFKSLPEEFIMYDGDYYHAERRQTITVLNIVERILEGIEEENESNDSENKYSSINLDAFKEEVLKKFIWSFQYDW